MKYREVPRLVNCPRCGGNHRNLRFMKLRRPCDDLTHWVLCPRTVEPILMELVALPGVYPPIRVTCKLALGS